MPSHRSKDTVAFCRKMFLTLFSRLTGRITHLIVIPWSTLFGVGGSAAAGISSEDWGRWSSEASPEQLLRHDQSRANQSMVLLNSGTNDYRRLFVLVVDTLSAVSLNSGNWFWRELCYFHEKMLRLILLSNSSLVNCKTKNISLLQLDVGLYCVSNLFLDVLLKTAWLCDLRLQNCDAANFVLFFLEHPLYSL